jgi:hypothetical protein
MKFRIPSLVIFVVISVLLTPPADLRASSLCVTVVDTTDAPLARAVVNVVGLTHPANMYSGLTDPAGDACIDQLAEGLYSVEASLEGFLNVRYYPVQVAFPRDIHLAFTLPLGETHEGGIQPDAVVNGTLGSVEAPLSGIKICMYPSEKLIPIACTVSNELGQYALEVPPGRYRVELSRGLNSLRSTTIELLNPGDYHNKIAAPAPK